ncbi:unnamed protein product [Ranitomeya imitator]|uniref:Uncharacterized protein n=1 Tax=Ranitomeya imitator TaxID=111125 RepID=A0ABN9KU26_9NEOB|nr:unnamed protein product [Ranitomeya imitator]
MAVHGKKSVLVANERYQRRKVHSLRQVDKWNRHDQKVLEAVEKGDAKKVSSILSKKQISATKTGPNGQSAFHLAASRGLVDCVSVILSHKVEINAKTDDGCTALHLAASNCHPECVKLLLQRGAHEDSIDFHSSITVLPPQGAFPAFLFCDAEDTVLLQMMADVCGVVWFIHIDGRTPLMIAAQRNHPTVCSLLLDRGARVDLCDRTGSETALLLACEKGNIQAAETLITRGADPTLHDSKGCDALHYTSLFRDEALRKLVQTALDRRKNNELHRNHDSPAGSKAVGQAPSREQELGNMWKKRYEEEQKRGVWLQGELMMKTQELERISEEHSVECSRIRDLTDTLDILLEGDSEKFKPKTEDYHISDTYALLTQLLEQVKSFKDQQLKERNRQEETIENLHAKSTKTGLMEKLHQEEMRRLQSEAAAAREKEEGARRRVTELEGHLENMREVLSQFEKRKRIQSTVVEDLQEQISEATREKEELLVLLQKLQEQEENVDNIYPKRLENEQALPDHNVLSYLIKKMKSNCIYIDIKQSNGTSQGCSGYVPKDVLKKNVDDWKSLVTGLENYMMAVERLQQDVVAIRTESLDPVLINGATGQQSSEQRLSRNTNEHYRQVENNIACLHANDLHQSKNSINQLESGSAQANDLAKSTDSLKQKITELESTVVISQEELLTEQDKLKKLNTRLEAQQNEMIVLRDSFPPEIIRDENRRSVEMFSSDILEEFILECWNPLHSLRQVDKWNRHDQKVLEAVEKGDAKKVSSILSKKQISATKTGPNGTVSVRSSVSDMIRLDTRLSRQYHTFHLAASRGLVDCVSVILSHKVEINAKTDDGCTALHLAASNCHPECVKLLLQDGRTPLMIAAQRNHPTVCSLLLDRGARVDLCDRDRKTALLLACEKGNIQAAETLITRGADPTLHDSKGCDALHYTSLFRDEALRKLVQTALDRRKNNELHRNHDSPAGSKAVGQAPSREQELGNMWKKRYEEEQKRGVWLQGELMMKTQELERISEEHSVECSRIRDLTDTLDILLEGDSEKFKPKTEDYHISDTYALLTQLLEQVKSFKDQQLKERNRQEETIENLHAKSTKTGLMEKLHQEEMRRLQSEAAAAREKEEGARRRVTELEGHLENMREVLSQFEKRKRIQSTVVEDLQEQISEATREKEELLVLLQKLQEQEENVDNIYPKRLENEQALPDHNVLSYLIKKMKSNCIYIDIKQSNGTSQGCSGYVPKDVLKKNVDDWKSLVTGLENYMMAVERLQQDVVAIRTESLDPVLINGATGQQSSEQRLSRNTNEHYRQVENNIACLHANDLHQSKNSINQLESGSAQANDLAKSTDSLKQKITELEAQLSSLKVTHGNLLTHMNHVVQEKQNLEEGLLALQESMQSEYTMRQETEKRCKDYKHQILVLSEELLTEQDKLKKLNTRLEAQQNEMIVLRDSFPPEIIRDENRRSVEMFSSDILEELYWNVGTLVRKYNDSMQEAAALQKENLKLLDDQVQTISMTEHKNILNEIKNQLHAKIMETEDVKQKLFQTTGSVVELKEQLAAQTSNSIPKEEFENRLVDLERIVTAMKDENEACKVALEGKCEEVIVLKQQLEQESEEGQTLRHKETSMVQEVEHIRTGLEIQIQALQAEVQGLSEKYIQVSIEAEGCQGVLSSEKEKGVLLEGKFTSLTKKSMN